MTMRKPVWFMVASRNTARLMRGQMIDGGRCHVQEEAIFEHESLEKEFHRPSSRMGRAGSTQESHIAEEAMARFARKVANELEKMMQEKGIGDMKLFAPPRMMGALKKAVPNRVADRINHYQADLAHLPDASLAKYPEVMHMVQSAPAIPAA
jgi:protein required for attachment to host cells